MKQYNMKQDNDSNVNIRKVSVYKVSIANYLLKKKFKILKIKPERSPKGKLVFYFHYVEGIYEEIDEAIEFIKNRYQ